MARSASDATRFTSTIPHAYAKNQSFTPNPSNTTILPKNRGPPGETPQEKVRRLRAAANAAREAQVSKVDKIISRGRVWADKAHRFTALSLIGLTFIAGGVTVYALGDMIIHNRTKRAQYFAQRKAQEEAALYEARQAIQNGTADERQFEFIKLRDEEDARIAKSKAEMSEKKGVFTRTKEWMFSGLKKDEQAHNLGSNEVLNGAESDGLKKGEQFLGTIEESKNVIAAKAKQAFTDGKERQKIGGPLDRLGTSETMDKPLDEPPKSGGWTSFMSRR